MSQQSEPGYLHVTGIDRAFSSVRKNLYLAGLSASKFPGSPKENYLLLDSDLDLFGEPAEYLRSKDRIERKKVNALHLAELASGIGSDIYVSYAGMNTADLKKDNASSIIYELYNKTSGTSATYEELEGAITKVGYFEPAISVSKWVGQSYVEGLKIVPKSQEAVPVENVGWNVKDSYSPSALETFFSCPRSFMLSRILRIPEPDERDPFVVIDPRDVGNVAHALMEQLAESDMTRDEFLKLSGEFFDRFIAQHPPLVPEKVADEKTVFIDMMGLAFNGDPHRKVILSEEDIECDHESGVTIHGYPDRVEMLDDGTCLIVDFKTGSKLKHIENDFWTCFQVIVYAYLMENKGYKVSSCEYRYLRLGETVNCKYDKEMRDKLTAALKLFKQMMLEGDFRCCNSLSDSCTYCKYAGVCTKDEDGEFWAGVSDDLFRFDDIEGESDND